MKDIEGETARGNLVVVVDFPTHPGFEDTISKWTVENHRAVVERALRHADDGRRTLCL